MRILLILFFLLSIPVIIFVFMMIHSEINILNNVNFMQNSLEESSNIQNKLQTFVNIESIQVHNTNEKEIKNGISRISINIRSGTRIQDINITELTVEFITPDGVQELNFSGDESFSTEKFGIRYITNQGESTIDGLLTHNDLVTINFISLYNLKSQEEGEIRISPKNGLSLGVEFNFFNEDNQTIVRLYP